MLEPGAAKKAVKKVEKIDDMLPGGIEAALNDESQFEKFQKKDVYGLSDPNKKKTPILKAVKIDKGKKEEPVGLPEGVPVFPLPKEEEVKSSLQRDSKAKPQTDSEGF